MDSAYMSGIAALAGSAIGGLASFATTWLTQHSQERARRSAKEITRREHLYESSSTKLRNYIPMPEPISSTIHQSLPVFRRLSGICGSALLPRSS